MSGAAGSQGGLEAFDPRDPDRARIERGLAVPCRICEGLTRRVVLTRRYCACCERGFCEAHGGIALGGRGSCIRCSAHA